MNCKANYIDIYLCGPIPINIENCCSQKQIFVVNYFSWKIFGGPHF